MSNKLVEAIVQMREAEAVRLTEEILASGTDPLKILDDCTEAMGEVGDRFENGEYFLPHLIMGGEILKQISALVKANVKGEIASGDMGRVLMGTVDGDIHNIGKDIVSFLLDVNGFKVRDIGVDVSPEKFVEEIKDFQPQVVGMSGLLTLAYDSMKNTVQAITNAGLRDSVKIMIGGAPMSEKVKEYAGADAYGKDAIVAVTLVKEWIGGE
jgi:5-methyltetrahydrofolate--homocysteine methyltransferase